MSRFKFLSLFFVTLFIVTLVAVGADAKKRTGEEAKEIETRLNWSHEFSGAVVELVMTPSGYLNVVARNGSGKKSPQTRYVMNYAGNILWQGDAANTVLLADSPNLVVMDASGGNMTLIGVAPSGSQKWSLSLTGIPASIATDSKTGSLLMVVMPYEWPNDTGRAYPAKVMSVNIATGAAKWSADIGEVKGEIGDFGGELGINNGKVMWAAGGSAFCADVASGKVLWKSAIQSAGGSGSIWSFGMGDVAVARGGMVSYFSETGGLKWQKSLKKVDSPSGLSIAPEGVVAYIGGVKNVVLTLLNKADGSTVWEKNLSHNSKKYGHPPVGISVYGGKVAVAAERHVTGFDVSSGEQTYDIKLKKDDFLSLSELRPAGDHFVLVGYEGATAYSTASGDKMWEQGGFVDPIMEIRRASQAIMSAALANLTVESAGSRQAWKEYNEGSRDFTSAVQTAAMANQIERLKNSQQGKNIATGISSLIEIELEVVNRRLGPDYAEFYRTRGSKLFGLKEVDKLDMALVNLLSGTVTESGTKKAPMGCVGQIMIDPASQKMVQAYRQMGLGCAHENKIEMYDY